MSRRKKFVITAIAYDKRGRIICTAQNNYLKSHPLQARYAKASGRPDAIYLHAEVAALIKASNKGQVVHRLEVIRFNKAGVPVNAKPCPSCQQAIADFGVSVVVHT